LQSELLQANVDRLSHPALAAAFFRRAPPPPLGFGAMVRGVAAPAVAFFLIEGMTKSLQFEDERSALWSQSARAAIVLPIPRRAVESPGFVSVSHGLRTLRDHGVPRRLGVWHRGLRRRASRGGRTHAGKDLLAGAERDRLAVVEHHRHVEGGERVGP